MSEASNTAIRPDGSGVLFALFLGSIFWLCVGLVSWWLLG